MLGETEAASESIVIGADRLATGDRRQNSGFRVVCVGAASSNMLISVRCFADIYGWPQAACEFPDWINHDAWRDLSGQYRVELDAKNRGSLTFHYKKRPSAREQVRTELRCVELLGQNTTGRSFTAVSFTSATCTSQHQCVMITQKDQDVIEIKLGELSQHFSFATQSHPDMQ